MKKPDHEIAGRVPARPPRQGEVTRTGPRSAAGGRPPALPAGLEEQADCIPDERMRLAGWILVGRSACSRGKAAIKEAIDRAILASWPDCVRLTIGTAGGLAIWRQPGALIASARAPFPVSPDIEHALRVIEAVGMGRGTILADEIARQHLDPSSSGRIRVLKAQLDADQLHFEAVAEAIRSFGAEAGPNLNAPDAVPKGTGFAGTVPALAAAPLRAAR